ncbi:MAG: ABC transporter ATP-binding protein [Candidatus Moranbacteria bacterium]|jgi:putative ABC transport system ATP-binding protein|nr:ABC transporter ATP-binding protein [Candidatus Moranbacteria bacterium]MBP9801041.1 ABC transporter ATP-binding protein [Candidatus Moranbacteria bacterium]
MAHAEIILKLENVGKTFDTVNGKLPILREVSFTVRKGEKVAIIGPSGSGKSTLLSLIGLLDTPTVGSIEVAGVNIDRLSESEQALFRNREIGFIFQSFELISPFTVAENIIAPLEIGQKAVSADAASFLMEKLALSERRDALPQTLSGGEKQRVAIGRALINSPALILADEPTGSLDRATGERVLSLLLDAVDNAGGTLIIITHDESIANRMQRVFEVKEGALYERS